MLHQNPLMADIDVDHWRNLQALLLESAKEKRRIVVIHEDGELLKFVHSERAEIVRSVERITRPSADAETIYRANANQTDFVLVLERRAVERLFAEVQDSWRADEDLDVYVHRMYTRLGADPEGIATYPGPPGSTLGLQWRVGARYEEVIAAVERYVPPSSTIVFGIFAGDALWAALVLGFDADHRITLITTADPSELSAGGGWKAAAKELTAWVDRKYPACSLGLFTDIESAKLFLASKDKLATLRELSRKGGLLADPVPKSLSL